MTEIKSKEPKVKSKQSRVKSKQANKPNNQVIIQHGSSPFTKYLAERKIKIYNPQVAKQLRHIDYFGLNYSVLMGAFIKASQSQSVGLFDGYVDKLIEATGQSVAADIIKYEKIIKDYENEGYVFKSEGQHQEITVRIYRNCLNDLASLFMQIDKLVTLLNHVEKTSHMKTPVLYAKISDWVGIPNQLNRKIIGLTKRLNNKFKFDAKSKSIAQAKVNYEKINGLLTSYHKEQIKVLSTGHDVGIKKYNSGLSVVEPRTLKDQSAKEIPLVEDNSPSEIVEKARNW
ncbi:hypothetical protein [Thalassotalea piscium]|uniref:DUF1845 domain-containing protein n=1 Tax=Thalassotalea piscium TaxID=1230533 RepID=A0A7X0TV69_9GAMM|nr:hypothetical protein [Thalassotalea piscium]MBB6545132.1 hypothetical protein [Thalassotalea piscium]